MPGQSVQTLRDLETAGFSAREGAVYTRDMLLSLKGIAGQHGHTRLAELLDAAAAEASRLARATLNRRQSAE